MVCDWLYDHIDWVIAYFLDTLADWAVDKWVR